MRFFSRRLCLKILNLFFFFLVFRLIVGGFFELLFVIFEVYSFSGIISKFFFFLVLKEFFIDRNLLVLEEFCLDIFFEELELFSLVFWVLWLLFCRMR